MTVEAHELARIAAGLKGRAQAAGKPIAPFQLVFFTDEKVTDNQAAILALPQSVAISTAVIFRHYKHASRKALARKLAAIAKQNNHLFLVAGDATLAHTIKADGLHVPERQLSQLPHLRAQFPQMILSAACHSHMALEKASRDGADCAFLSPIFPTTSHNDNEAMGVGQAQKIIAQIKMPVLALGGLNSTTAGQLEETDFQGIGAVDAFKT